MYEVCAFNPYRISTLINNMTKTKRFVWGAKRMIFLDNKKGKSVSMNCKRFINSKRAELLRLSKVYVRKHIPYLIFLQISPLSEMTS